MLLQNQEAKDFSGLLSTLQVFSHQPLQANYPCTPAQLFPLLRKIHHETTRQGALGSGSPRSQMLRSNPCCAEGPGWSGLGPSSVSPFVKGGQIQCSLRILHRSLQIQPGSSTHREGKRKEKESEQQPELRVEGAHVSFLCPHPNTPLGRFTTS